MNQLKSALHGKKCLLFLDLEGTQTTHEMIEIGAYKVILRDDLTVKKVFKPYHAFVQAKHRVGPIVTKLTGITDLKLKKDGIPFRLVQQQIKKYMGKDYKDFLCVSYGPEDAHIILCSVENNMDCSVEDGRYLARRFFDLAEFVGRYVRSEGNNLLSLTNILSKYEVQFEGTAHNAQADAYNLLLLYKAFLERPDITKSGYKKTLLARGHVAPSIRQALSALCSGQSVTPDDFDRFIDEEFA